jgi:hypothetical protein
MIDMALIVVPFVAIIAALVWMFRRPQSGSSGYQSENGTNLYNGSMNHTQTPTPTHTHHHNGGNNGGGGW